MEDHNRQHKIAVINDFTSFGRCSLAVTIPILSAMRVQCCPVPTAIFTNHTGFECFSWTDYTDHMDDYIHDWKKLDLRFSAIMSGFLGSRRQIDFVKRFIDAFRTEETIVVVDPVMGDYGRLYPTYDRSLAESMREFLGVADILTPNLTEACVLASREYDPEITDVELKDLCADIAADHARKVVISGIQRGDNFVNFVYEQGGGISLVVEKRVGEDRSGTGDVFASIIAADAVNGVPFLDSVRKASSFTAHAVRRTVALGVPVKDGLAIEEVLPDLYVG